MISRRIERTDPLEPNTKMLLGNQLRQPLLELSGACAGCGETPYVKLLTPICGDRLLIANLGGLLVDLRRQSADHPVI